MSQPPPLDLVYSFRPSLIEKERRWVLLSDTLAWSAEEFHDMTLLSDIAEIRLEYSPTRYVARMYRCHIRTRSGKAWQLKNHHFAGVGQFEDRSETYRDLIENLIARVASQQPQCKFRGGVSWLNWLFSTLFMCGSLFVLAIVLFYMWTAVGWLVIVKMLIIAFFLPRAFLWISRNRPKAIDPRNIPAELLP